jgi:hypothetical protein
MTVGADVTMPPLPLRLTVRRGADLGRGSHLTPAAPWRGDRYGWRRRRWNRGSLDGLLTGSTVGRVDETMKRFGLSRALLGRRGCRWASGGRPIGPPLMKADAEPEKREQHQRRATQLRYPGKAPSLGGETGLCYRVCSLRELSTPWRYTTALLVKATAMGLDLNSVLNDINSPLPHYRFSVLIQKALELCSELKSLGGALLSALEKKDAEELTMLRTSQELSLLKAAREIKVQQLLEAKAGITALERSKDIVQARQWFYTQALANDLNPHEESHLDHVEAANDKQGEVLIYDLIAQATSQIPNATVGSSGWASPVMTAQFSGSNLSSANTAYSHYLTGEAADETYKAMLASIAGSDERRQDDWSLQLTLTNREIAQIDKQIAAAEIRATVAQNELQHHDRQVENSAMVEESLKNNPSCGLQTIDPIGQDQQEDF